MPGILPAILLINNIANNITSNIAGSAILLTILPAMLLIFQQYCWSIILLVILLETLPAILVIQQYCCQYCQQYCWLPSNIAGNIASNIANNIERGPTSFWYMNLGHFSSFLANFQLSHVDISKRKILPSNPRNWFLPWQKGLQTWYNSGSGPVQKWPKAFLLKKF